MNVRWYKNFLMAPAAGEGDSGGGGTATATGDDAAAGGTGGDGGQNGAAPAPKPNANLRGGKFTLNLDGAKGGGSGAAQDGGDGSDDGQPVDLSTKYAAYYNKDGKFLGGRFDNEGQGFTPEEIEADPRLQKMVQSFTEGEKRYSQLEQGKMEKFGISAAHAQELDMTVDEKGNLPPATIRALNGKMITPDLIRGFFAPFAARFMKLAEMEQTSWLGRMDSQHGVSSADVFRWIEASVANNTMTKAQAQRYVEGLNDEMLRDDIYSGIVAKFNAAGGVEALPKEPAPKQHGQSGGDADADSNSFRDRDAAREFMKKVNAERDPAKREKLDKEYDRRLANSQWTRSSR